MLMRPKKQMGVSQKTNGRPKKQMGGPFVFWDAHLFFGTRATEDDRTREKCVSSSTWRYTIASLGAFRQKPVFLL